MTFLRNCWYAAAWADEVADQPFARTVLDQPIVFFRKTDQTVVALADRGCHRGLPLSMGLISGDSIQCGYHGLVFDDTGQCIGVPGQSSIPPGAAVGSYPVTERWRWIWVWLGDPAQANPDLVPDFHWLCDPGWVGPTGHFHVTAHYQRLIDNLTDHTHLQFVHEQSLGSDAVVEADVTTERVGDALRITRMLADSAPPPLLARAGGFTGNVDRWMDCWLTPAANFVLDAGCAPVGAGAREGDRSQGIEIKSLHTVTPETETTTHYFWAFVRNFALDDPEITESIRAGAASTFLEDVDILEAQERSIAVGPETPSIDRAADAPPLLERDGFRWVRFIT